MALKPVQPNHPRTVGEVPHDSLVRVDRRVKQILAQREAALQQARRAAEKLTAPRRELAPARPRTLAR
jgi:hypothetical protein